MEDRQVKRNKTQERICPARAQLYDGFDRTFRWVIKLMEAIPTEANFVCSVTHA